MTKRSPTTKRSSGSWRSESFSAAFAASHRRRRCPWQALEARESPAQLGPQLDDRLVFLGDYIDRGPDSYEFVERLVDLRRDLPNTVPFRGNHEELVLSLFREPVNGQRGSWLGRDGGRLTIASYQAAGHSLAVHREFFASLLLNFETRHCFFCHAGVRPGFPSASSARRISSRSVSRTSRRRPNSAR